MTLITRPAKGDRILYRHGRADLPYGTPDVVPGTVYDVVVGEMDGIDPTSAAPLACGVVVVLAHDAMGDVILGRGQAGEPARRLPRVPYSTDAVARPSWCYVPDTADRQVVDVPDPPVRRPAIVSVG